MREMKKKIKKKKNAANQNFLLVFPTKFTSLEKNPTYQQQMFSN